jgi:hypothetical protein
MFPMVRFAVRVTVVSAVISEVKFAVKVAPPATVPLVHGAVVASSQLPPVVADQVPVAAKEETVNASENATETHETKRLKRELFMGREREGNRNLGGFEIRQPIPVPKTKPA